MSTIVSISTALGSGAISIVRLSGEDAISIVNKKFKGKDLSKVKSHTVHYGHIYDGETCVDEVLVSVFRAPKTYTMEDVVEINCHGGMFVTNKVLELMVDGGAEIAEPGEFTKRAFMNGRIDLTQAEAVMDVISSETNNSLKCANLALKGDVYKMIVKFQSLLMDCITKIEVNIDYPEYEDEFIVTNEYLLPRLMELKSKLEDILSKANDSTIIKEGIKTAIIGKPNVGKSSLLNALLGEEKAIVTNIAGTTRDTIEGKINLGGIILNLIDTAGVRDTSDVVEKIGVEKSKKVLEEAELVILILDNSNNLEDIDKELINMTKDKKRLVIINKMDLPRKIDFVGEALEVSILNEDDLGKIEQRIKKLCISSEINNIDATYIGNTRQISLIKKALKSIKDAINGINEGLPVDIINVDIRSSYLSLGEVIGKGSPEDIIDNLFANFCLGK